MSEIVRLIEKLKSIKEIIPETVFSFYDSPNRINQTLRIIDQHWPDIDMCVCRELTKQYEEIYHGKASQLKDEAYKGEITVVMS